MTKPLHIVWFEALLLVSLLIDIVSMSFWFQSDVPPVDREGVIVAVIFLFAVLLMLIWLAAERAKNWARWALTVLFSLSALLSLMDVLEKGLTLAALTDGLSLAVATYGLSFSFTAEGQAWFARS